MSYSIFCGLIAIEENGLNDIVLKSEVGDQTQNLSIQSKFLLSKALTMFRPFKQILHPVTLSGSRATSDSCGKGL